MESKVCSKCKRELPRNTDYFFKKKGRKDGLWSSCKECEGHPFTMWLSKTHKKCSVCKEVKKKSVEYFNLSKTSRDGYRCECKECMAKRFKEYRLANLEKIATRKKEWKKANKEHVLTYSREYRQKNLEQCNGYKTSRRTKIKSIKNTLTHTKWIKIKTDFGFECAYCGMTEEEHKKLTGYGLSREHFIPLDKGGEFSHDNIIPSCKMCNSSKFNKDFFDWYPTYQHYDKKRERFILEYLNYTTEETQQLALFK